MGQQDGKDSAGNADLPKIKLVANSSSMTLLRQPPHPDPSARFVLAHTRSDPIIDQLTRSSIY